MTFLYPSFLWGLLALSIPIIIHLFNFRRAKKIFFSNVKFLENVKESSSSKLKIKYLLVLMARLLFITFLVLAFAQPFLPGNEKGLDSNLVTVYFDNSQSSSNHTESDITGLSTGVDYLSQIIDLYSAETKFKIITNDFAPSSINFKTKDKALELTTEIDYSNLSRSFQDVSNKVKSSAQQSQSGDIYIISDFQKSIFKEVSEQFEDSINNYKIIPLKYASQQNVFVDSIFLESPFLIANNTNRLHVKLKSVGKEDSNDLLVKLFINGSQAATTSADIATGSSKELVFDLNYRLEDINKCLISFEDFPMTFDNEYYFTLNLLKKIRIVEISDENSPFLGSVFSENDLFGYSRFDEGAINFNQASNADLVIFNQLSNMNNSIKGLIADLTNSDKSVFIIPSEHVVASEIEQIVGLAIQKVISDEKIEADIPDIRNPFFDKILESVDRKTLMPSANPVLLWNSTTQDILKFKSGQPLLSYLQPLGRVYLLATPLKDEYTNFQKHALFVPIMYRMAALSSNSYYPLSYTIDNQLIAVDKDTVLTNELYRLTNAQEELIPQQQISSDKLILDIPRYLINPGYYDLTLAGEVKNILAFNFATEESYTASLGQEEIAESFSKIKKLEILHDQKVETFTETMKAKYEGAHLWKYALILSLIFLLAEVLLLRFL